MEIHRFHTFRTSAEFLFDFEFDGLEEIYEGLREKKWKNHGFFNVSRNSEVILNLIKEKILILYLK